MNTGSLIIENIDVYLPGRNGLDLKLVSRYDSGKHIMGEKEYIQDRNYATFYDIDIKYNVYLHGPEILIAEGVLIESRRAVCRAECERLEDIYDSPFYFPHYIIDYGDESYRYEYYMEIDDIYDMYGNFYSVQYWFNPTYDQKNSPLGLGWSFVFDSIEIVNDDKYYNDFVGRWAYFIDKSKGKYLHLENGQTYEIDNNLNLVGYKFDDMWLEQSNAYTNGQNVTSYYVLKYKDGTKKYFAQDGRLLAKVDRYNNTIEYQHTLIRNHPVVTKIIDTLNREVTIDYDFDNLQVVVTARITEE